MDLKQILDLIHRRRLVTRGEIADYFDVSHAIVTNTLKDLFGKELIVETGYRASTGGRRSAELKLNPDRASGIGVEVSRSGIRGMIMKFDGEIVYEYSVPKDGFPVGQGVQDNVDRIKNCVRELLGKTDNPAGIGIAISGIVDRENGISKSFPDFMSWEDVRLREEIRNEFSIPVYIEPLIHAGVRGEFIYGAGNGCSDFMYIHLGKGISCAGVFNNRVHYGSSGTGGELGHTSAETAGPLCYCGKYGCLESVASPLFIERAVAQAVSEGVTTRCSQNGEITMDSILTAADEGDKLARNVIEKAGGYLGRAASNLCNIFAPDAVIVGSEFISEDNILFKTVRHEFRSHVMDSCQACRLVPGALRDRAALAGACDKSFTTVLTDM